MVAGHGTRDRHHFTRNVQELSAVFGFQMDQTPKTELINNFVIFKFYCIVWIQTVGNLFLLLPDFLLFWGFLCTFHWTIRIKMLKKIRISLSLPLDPKYTILNSSEKLQNFYNKIPQEVIPFSLSWKKKNFILTLELYLHYF